MEKTQEENKNIEVEDKVEEKESQELAEPERQKLQKDKTEVELELKKIEEEQEKEVKKSEKGFLSAVGIVSTGVYNDNVLTINERFGNIQSIQKKTYETIAKVFNIIDTIDEGYIKSFKGQIKVLKESSVKLGKNEKELRGTVTFLNGLVGKLKEHKEKLERLKHLEDIDEIAERLYAWEDKIVVIKNLLNELGENIDENSRETSRIELELKEKLFSLEETLEEVEKSFETELSQQREESDTKIKEQEESFSERIKEQEKNFSNKLQKLEEKQSSMNQELIQKIKNAYLIGGAAGVLAIIELIIILVKVL